ncbi:iron-sulfur cluster insertion protein ErpA [Candidatus Tachikawaea gelatinosa]|uniref:Iron-sulfur cluster insertion protein ErpA n=1 Tax=Candidatus Tachikawaea gelatinosa TaxID=1410383 RepID=A0A090AL95_9ENTR|nr:iron-sulfur cluster insertion protein ErpA [Candidatus Tachikawaea gelatinosa]BAP58389.1 iron-sulfur cluster insertion protein ErpA [Candidatus Tachikawaea gelatinosa]
MNTNLSPHKLNCTDNAINKLKSLMYSKKNMKKKLRIAITGGGCNGFQYNFIFDEKINEDDIVLKISEVFIVIDYISFQYLDGGSLDYIENFSGSRFTITNPKAKTTCSCGYSFSLE